MARIRSINPCAPVDEDVATMSLAAKYVWAYLPCHADREGRMKDSPFTIKLDILPTENVDMNAVLDELAARRHIIRYEVDGRRYIQIRSFSKHQRPHNNEVSRKLPPPPGWVSDTDAQNRDIPGGLGAKPERDANGSGIRKEGSGERDPDRAPPPPTEAPPNPLPDAERSGLWSAHFWLTRFSAAWCANYGRIAYGNGPQDAKATGALSALLASLPDPERLHAQSRADAMVKAYLSDSKAGARGHPWQWFVDRFNELRVSDGNPRGSPGKSQLSSRHAEAEAKIAARFAR